MNSLAQLAAIYDEDNDVDEDKQACSSSYSCTQIVKKGKKRVREDEQDKADAVFDPPEANKSRCNFEIISFNFIYSYS